MEKIFNYGFHAVLLVIMLGCIGFIFPFIRQIWIKPSMLLWGFYIGSRKKTALIQSNLANQNNSAIQSSIIKSQFEENVKNERETFETVHQQEVTDIEDKIKKNDNKLKRKNEVFTDWKANKRELKKRFIKIENQISTAKKKNLVLLFIVAIIVFIDTLIARQIFQSLGLFTETLEIFGYKMEFGYQYLYGLFITIVIALFLHFALKSESINEFFHTQKFRIFNKLGPKVVLLIFFVVFLLLLMAVLFPDSSKSFIEITMRLCWLLGVLVVYWFVDQIIGKDNDYIQLFLPLVLVFLAIGWIFFGLLSLIQLFLANIIQYICEFALNVKGMRLQRKKDNEALRYSNLKQGFSRGLNF